MPWWSRTVRCASAEFGPPPGARWQRILGRYSDAELIDHGPQIVRELERARREGRPAVVPVPRARRGLTRGTVRRAA